MSWFEKARVVEDEPVLSWWVPYTLMKDYLIIFSIKTHIRKIAHKYGIDIQTSVEHAYKIDDKNINHFC